MAEVVENPPPTGGNVGGTWNSFVHIIANYWWVLLLFGLLIAVIVVCFMIWKKKEENDRRRDSAVYATAMNLYGSAEHNANEKWKRKYYSWWNLLWFGIPFKWNEHSVHIVDVDRNLLGYYRGHTYTQDGDLVILLYKYRIWLGLVEDKFLLYCPLKLRVPKLTEDKKTKKPVIMKNEDGKIVYEYEPLPKDFIKYDTERGNEIRIKCNTITKQGNYYFFPNYIFVTEDGQKHIDLTDHITQQIAKTNYYVALENGYSDMSRVAGRAVEVNPHLRFKQKEPEKEKQIEEESGNTDE